MPTLPLLRKSYKSPLLRTVTCLNCWHTFPPESAMWLSVHPSQMGEPQLPASAIGKGEPKRFIPERFDVEGRAIDAAGAACTQIACPRCRLTLPRHALEIPPLIFSLLGAAGSGKSVFLASMMFTLRQRCATYGLRLQDADLTLNHSLLEDERRLFLSGDSESYRGFDEAVKKTSELDDPRWRASLIEGNEARFVPPYAFLLSPAANHPRSDEEDSLTRLLCLYDNAGEHFRPGADASTTPMTRHLAKSKGLMFTFDPTRDRRVCRLLGDISFSGTGDERQDVVLLEAANRIREHSGLASRSRISQPLVVILTKYDVWYRLLEDAYRVEAFSKYPGKEILAIASDSIDQVSQLCRAFLTQTCPEIVTTADSISDEVYFVPIAAVGWDIRMGQRGVQQFRGADMEPHWVEVPLMILLSRIAPRLVPTLRRPGK